jgi:CRP/FNR family transcriptional regulator
MYLAPPAAAGEPAQSTLCDLLQMMRVAPAEAGAMSNIPVPVRHLRSGDTLFHEGVPAESIYFVRSGTLKSLHTAEDGYEQVLGFFGRTEVLGFDAVSASGHPTEAVALEDSSVYVLRIHDLNAWVQKCRPLGYVVHRAVSEALIRQCELADVMAAVASEVRLARFLLHLSHRMAACGQSPQRFLLRMSRRDIASLLGIAHETVSRSFSSLAERGLIQVSNREVTILDLDLLNAHASSTRGQQEDLPLSAVH